MQHKSVELTSDMVTYNTAVIAAKLPSTALRNADHTYENESKKRAFVPKIARRPDAGGPDFHARISVLVKCSKTSRNMCV